MEMSIDSKTENKLFGRTEVKFSAVYDGATPSRKAIKDEVSKHVGANAERIVIVEVKTTYGTHKCKGGAYVYSSKDALNLASRHLLVRDGMMEKKKKEPKKKAAAPAKK
ncbi:MAG TPA: hypothetical protein PLO51_00635 [Candidatus Micrarchaeota archaeon]|nr:hypothetical protein [Candidatus Micrarchaeota archaeon]